MATHSYRICGTFNGQCSLGSAVVGLLNISSTRKVRVRAVEVLSFERFQNTLLTNSLRLVRGGTATPAEMEATPIPFDTDDTWPSSVHVHRDAAVTGSLSTLVPLVYDKSTLSVPTDVATRNYPMCGMILGLPLDPDLEAVTLGEGESLHLLSPDGSSVVRNLPFEVDAIIRVGDADFGVNFVTYLLPDRSIFSLVNDSGSALVVKLVQLSARLVGDSTTPYFQVVPVGNFVGDAESAPVLKWDTGDPDAEDHIRTYIDAPIMPYGMPENAISDASASGTPKGSNYLKAKDFVGPVWGVMFYEFMQPRLDIRHDAITGTVGFDVLPSNEGVILRPGEGLALVSSAETAATSFVTAPQGKAMYQVTIDFDLEALFAPVLTLTGLKNPTEIRVFEAGTTTEVGGQENVTSGTFSFPYDPEVLTSVDIAILSLGYQNIRLTSVALGTSDVTIPVQQQLDRQYNNP